VDRLIGLVLLRWRLEVRSLLAARERAIGLALLLPTLLLGSALGSFLAFLGTRSLMRANPDSLLPLLSALATAAGLLWVLSPLLAGIAFSETHDVSRLLHFPVPLPTLAASSLLANLTQPLVVAATPVALALALALAEREIFLPLCFTGVLLGLGFLLAASQLMGLLLHGLARNRRLQDLILFLGLGAGFLLSLLPVLVSLGKFRTVAAILGRIVATDVFALSPFAWGLRAAAHAGRGELLPFLALAGLATGAIVAATGASAFLIHRVHRGELALAPSGRLSRTRTRMVFSGDLGALVEKDLVGAWRDPALKASLFMGLIGPLLFLFLLSQATSYGRSESTLLILATFIGASSFGSNAFGLERRGISLLMSFPVPRWRILVAKNISALLFRLPGLVTLVLASVFLSPVSSLPAGLTIALVTMLLSSGADNYISILFPSAAAEPGKNPYGGVQAGGRGLGGAAMGGLLFVGALILATPFIFLCWLPLLMGQRSLWWISLPLAAAGAGAAYAMLTAGAESLLKRREPEMLERILGGA
jgi:hypothetical protein